MSFVRESTSGQVRIQPRLFGDLPDLLCDRCPSDPRRSAVDPASLSTVNSRWAKLLDADASDIRAAAALGISHAANSANSTRLAVNGHRAGSRSPLAGGGSTLLLAGQLRQLQQGQLRLERAGGAGGW